MKTIFLPLIAALFMLLGAERGWSLTIILQDIGGTPPTNSIGTGCLSNTMYCAKRVWESAIRDQHTVTLYYGWAEVGGGQHSLITQMGTPNREVVGAIFFNNDSDPTHQSWHIDSTPLTWNDFTNTTYSQKVINLGIGGPINASRCYRWDVSPNTAQLDLFTIALHEIGHALGMSYGNNSFMFECADGDIDVTSGPFWGMTIPMQSNFYGVVSHIAYVSDRTLMAGSFAPGERALPSVLDIVAIAQLSQFKELNLDLKPVLEMSTPYDVQGELKVDLTWLQLLPLPAGMRVALESTQSLDGSWSEVESPVIDTDGLYRVTIPASTTVNAFFRLVLK